MTIQSDMALMAAGSYWDVRKDGIGFDNDAPTPSGWKVLTQFDKGDSGPNAVTGFSARVYQNISTGDIAISYGGTEFKVNGYLPTAGLVADFLSGNIPLAVGNASAQALAAAKLYQEVKADATLSDNISFTGQYVGVHLVLPGQCRNGNPGLQACGHQFCFEFWRVGPVGASG